MVRLFFVVPVYDPCLCGITAGSTLTTNFFPPSHSEFLRQHRTIPALRLKHRSGSCGTAAALPKCSIMSGCGTRHRASGAKAPRTLRPLPLLRFAVSATGGAHLCSIQYYLRFWPSICRTSLAVSALRIMRYCPKSIQTKTPRRPAFEPDGGVLLIESNGAGERAYWSSFTKLRTASAMASAVRP